MALTPRGKTLRWLKDHRYLTEQPFGSNTDERKDGIRAAQQRIGLWLVGKAWCGVWAVNGALAGGVKISQPWRWASVANIEDDARRGTNGFRDWRPRPARTGIDWQHVYRGDLAVLFGRGKHVETIRSCRWIYRKLGLIRTEGGNTRSDDAGSQSNGGGSYPRWRRISDIHGIARVRYPR